MTLDGLKVYVAAPFSYRERAQEVGEKLVALGAEITEPWWMREGAAVRNHNDISEAFALERARADVAGVRAAHVVLALMPETGGCGMWWECGIAYQAGIPIFEAPLKDVLHYRGIFDQLTRRFSTLEASIVAMFDLRDEVTGLKVRG